MKYLLILGLLALLAWWWTRRNAPPAAPPPKAEGGSEAMLRCLHCGTHLPASLAWPGRGGSFCSAEHRAAHEGGDPA